MTKLNSYLCYKIIFARSQFVL
uniref:Uncharacterized protein n=1 Tax=Anguilla anguilla TaxID=7936 RepID=A0A0E9TMX6_ANGAN